MTVFPAGGRPNPLDGEADGDSRAAPPRANGELVFTASWQSRLFATTMRLWEQERFEWDTFRDRLIEEIAAHEAELGFDRDHPADGGMAGGREPQEPTGDQSGDGGGYDYWGCWLRALEGVLTELQLVTAPELDSAGEAIAARPPDH
ncbi:MAG: hypothetical protein R2761_24350 [Acidimicrobiales bacterium]